MNGKYLNNLRFVNDVVLGHVERIYREASEVRGLNCNLDKTIIMMNAKNGGKDIKMGSSSLRKV